MTEQDRRDHIKKLVNEAIDKYENKTIGTSGTFKKVARNKNPDSYIGFAEELNNISRQLSEKDPEKFREDSDGRIGLDNKFKISPAQIRNACVGEIDNPKQYFYETLHWYLYDQPSRMVEPVREEKADQPTYEDLITNISEYEKKITDLNSQSQESESHIAGLNRQIITAQNQIDEHKAQLAKQKKGSKFLWVLFAILLVLFLASASKWYSINHEFTYAKKQIDSVKYMADVIKQDMRILPYQPTPTEISQLEGVYMVYTGSPQTRKSDPDRYHKVVPNILVVTYKEGYFTFDRFGSDFDQKGFMQFEDSNLVSMHSYMINSSGKKSPKKSLILMEKGKDTFTVISSSWSFDPNPRFNISLGIREVFIRLGKPGSITQVVNSPRNFGKQGKLFDLRKDGKIETIHIQNVKLETLPKSIGTLLNEKSILLKDPDPSLLLERPLK